MIDDMTSQPAIDGSDTAHLTTGWEQDLPLGDTIVRQYLYCWSALCQAFAVAGGGRAVTGPAVAIADLGTPSGWFNAATLLQPPHPDTFDGVLAQVESFFDHGSGEAHLWSAWPTPDLRSRGWRLEGHPPLMVRPPASLVPPPAPPAVEVTAVENADDLASWERVAIGGYPLPELDGSTPGSMADPRLLDDPRLRFSLGWEAGEPVSLGTLFTEAGVGCFALGVTVPTSRGRGHWNAHAIRRLVAEPDAWMTGVFSDHSRPPAERLGFLPVLRMTLWARPRPSPQTPNTDTNPEGA
jgi:hypothetical protein